MKNLTKKELLTHDRINQIAQILDGASLIAKFIKWKGISMDDEVVPRLSNKVLEKMETSHFPFVLQDTTTIGETLETLIKKIEALGKDIKNDYPKKNNYGKEN